MRVVDERRIEPALRANAGEKPVEVVTRPAAPRGCSAAAAGGAPSPRAHADERAPAEREAREQRQPRAWMRPSHVRPNALPPAPAGSCSRRAPRVRPGPRTPPRRRRPRSRPRRASAPRARPSSPARTGGRGTSLRVHARRPRAPQRNDCKSCSRLARRGAARDSPRRPDPAPARRPWRRPRLLPGDLPRGAHSRRSGSRTGSSRTTTRARTAACCAACTSRSATARRSWCAARGARSSTSWSTSAAGRPPSASGRPTSSTTRAPRSSTCPIGFAHGFCVTSEVADVIYKCSTYYDPALERGIAYDDPDLGIEWPGHRASSCPSATRRPRGSPKSPTSSRSSREKDPAISSAGALTLRLRGLGQGLLGIKPVLAKAWR